MRIINKLTLALTLAVNIIATCSCSSNRQGITQSIKYSQAKNYFVLNTIDKSSFNVIGSQQDFDALFGEAATMGKNGEPTSIDFDKQSVIAVIMKPTDHPTIFETVSLVKKAQKITFNYKAIAEPKEVSYTMTPCLLIIVSKNDIEDSQIAFEKK
jgi:hypothetical protein